MQLIDIAQNMIKEEIRITNPDKHLLNDFSLLLTEKIKYSRSVKYYANLLAVSTKKNK